MAANNNVPNLPQRGNPNYTRFNEEPRVGNRVLPRAQANARIQVKVLEAGGDYVGYSKPDIPADLEITRKRPQAYDISLGLKNIILGSTTWKADIEQIVSTFSAVRLGRGTVNMDGRFTPSPTFERVPPVPVPLQPWQDELLVLLFTEYFSPQQTNLEIRSRQIDIMRRHTKNSGTKYEARFSRSFQIAGQNASKSRVVLSPTSFRYDFDNYLNLWRILTGNVTGRVDAVDSVVNSWILTMGKYLGPAPNDASGNTNLLELPANVVEGWTEVPSYADRSALHVSARLLHFILNHVNHGDW